MKFTICILIHSWNSIHSCISILFFNHRDVTRKDLICLLYSRSTKPKCLSAQRSCRLYLLLVLPWIEQCLAKRKFKLVHTIYILYLVINFPCRGNNWCNSHDCPADNIGNWGITFVKGKNAVPIASAQSTICKKLDVHFKWDNLSSLKL